MKKHGLSAALALGLVLSTSAFARPRATAPKSNIPAELAKETKISLEEARKIALAVVPGGTIRSEELETEKGRLIYSFDIKVGKRSGIEEVGVDAVSGKIIEKKHESNKAEKAEAKAEAKKTGSKS